jgi:GH35 family endo-1,4-beta-xylanase
MDEGQSRDTMAAMFARFALLLPCLVTMIHAASIPEGGKDLLSADWQSSAKAQGSGKLWKTAKADFGEHGKGWRLEVLDDKATPFQLQLTCLLDGEVKSGDKVLLVFNARCVPGSSDDGKGRVNVVVENKEPPTYEKLGQDGIDLAPQWETIYVPFPANANSKPGLTHASLLPGGKKQTLEVANMRLINFGAAFDLAKLPRPYLHYPGREADAPWRKAALDRIEKMRTTDIAIEVVDAKGKPVPEAKVSVDLKRHHFAFGTAVKAKYLMGTDETSKKYREIVDQNFSAIVLENDLKPFAWDKSASNTGKDYRQEWTVGALAWAKERGMRARGHYLCWGPWEPWSEKLKDDPQAIHDHVMKHMDDVIRGAGGLVDEWDAVNHPVGWESPRRTVDQVVGKDFYAEVFKAAKARTGLPLFINEDQVFRPGRQQDEFYELIKELIAKGAAPTGIGNQAHFHSSYLPGAEEMLRISDRFAALVPNLELTEFDVNTNGDEELQADWLRDTLIMAYSHPAYTGVMLWVFYEGAGWKPECALWRNDWSEKPNAKVWKSLVGKLWHTQASGSTATSGTFSTRGHRGLYEVTVDVGGQKVVHTFNTERGSGMLRVVLP